MLGDQIEDTILDKIQRMQDGLLSSATGGEFPGGDDAFKNLRRELIANSDTRTKLPDFVRQNRDLSQFWHFIKHAYGSYAERRMFIWQAFHSLIDDFELRERHPGAMAIDDVLLEFDPDRIHAVWQKALNRRATDPEGAITVARTLLESVCKHVLDDAGVDYASDIDLPKLWALCAEQLNLAPHQHEEKLFKTILGNAQQVVNSLGALRNKIGDAHGVGRKGVKPKPRHAELAVNLAGAMASFVIATWKDRSCT